jgi:hypothetical protein
MLSLRRVLPVLLLSALLLPPGGATADGTPAGVSATGAASERLLLGRSVR